MYSCNTLGGQYWAVVDPILSNHTGVSISEGSLCCIRMLSQHSHEARTWDLRRGKKQC
jgi:hypothetical protein